MVILFVTRPALAVYPLNAAPALGARAHLGPYHARCGMRFGCLLSVSWAGLGVYFTMYE